MNKTLLNLSPDAWVTETKAMMPLCTSATATVDPLAEGDEINVFIF